MNFLNKGNNHLVSFFSETGSVIFTFFPSYIPRTANIFLSLKLYVKIKKLINSPEDNFRKPETPAGLQFR